MSMVTTSIRPSVASPDGRVMKRSRLDGTRTSAVSVWAELPGRRQLEGQRETEIGDERERVRRIDRDRRQHREDLLAEQPLQIFHLVGRQVVRFVDHHVLGEQLLAQRLPVILLLELQMLGERRDLLELLGRRQPVGALRDRRRRAPGP